MGFLGPKDDDENRDSDGNLLEDCPHCGGSGTNPGLFGGTCDVCHGKRKVPPKKWLTPS